MFVLATDIHGSEDSYKINFEEIENVSSAFSTLFSIFQKVISALNDDEFQIIKNACMAQADESLCSLLHSASNSHCLFRVLAENKLYCNWIRINFLEIIAYAHVNQYLVNLIKNYKKAIFSKPLHKVWSSLPHYSVRDQYYTELKATFDDKDPDNVTVEELFKITPNLAKKIEMLIAVVQKKSLVVAWLIPTNKVYEAYLSFLAVPQQSRTDQLFEFGNWMAYLPQNVMAEVHKIFGQFRLTIAMYVHTTLYIIIY